MAYPLFILVNAVLFIRPAEIFPGVEGAPIYQASILACLAVAFPRVASQLSFGALSRRPVTFCILGIWATAILSHLVRLNLREVAWVGSEFGKVVLYYLLLVGLVDSPRRLRNLLFWLAGLITVSTALAVLHFHDQIDLPGLRIHRQKPLDPQPGEVELISRLCGPGIFSDPNDFSMALTLCALISLYALMSLRRAGRWLWTGPLLLCGYALLLTKSRGGLLGFLVGLFVLSGVRYGWRKVLLVALIGASSLLFVEGRQADFDMSNPQDTFQGRIQLWALGLKLQIQSPLFGIGPGMYAKEVGLVAHNSFIHAFTELGFFGGSFFLGAFGYAVNTLRRLARARQTKAPSELKRLCPYLFAAVAGTIAALLSLSRVYTYQAYVVLGIVAVYFRLVTPFAPSLVLGVSSRLVSRFLLLGMIFLPAAHLFVMLFVRWR
jgi:hypothetical protein